MDAPAAELMPIDYRANSRHWLVADLFLLLMWGLSAVYQRVTFDKIFGDLDVPLPTLTTMILSVPLAAVLGAVFILAAVLVTKEFVVRDVWVRRVWNIITGVVLIVMVVVHMLALLLPLTEVLSKVG
jgi:hypothetical protein